MAGGWEQAMLLLEAPNVLLSTQGKKERKSKCRHAEGRKVGKVAKLISRTETC